MANKLYLLLEMPERFHGDNCDRCPTTWRCHEIHGGPGACPLGPAKDAVEVGSGFDVCWGESQAYDFHTRKPVKLYAVEVKD